MVVNAACPNAERVRLNALANNVTADWEVRRDVRTEMEIDREISESPIRVEITDYTFFGKVFGVTQDLYIIVRNSVNNEIRAYSSGDARDGIITFNDLDENAIIRYTIEVYASTGDCYHLIRTLHLTIPMVNVFSTNAICEEEAAQSHYLCQEFLSVEVNHGFRENLNLVRQYIDNNQTPESEEETSVPRTFFDIVFDFLEKYSYFFIGGIVIAVGVMIFVMIRRKRRKI